MGNQPISKCNKCQNDLYHDCQECYRCCPILKCKDCRKEIKEVILINPCLEYQTIKQIYDKGQIIQIQCYTSRILSSKIPFSSGKLLYHALMQLTVQTAKSGKKKIILDCQRDSGKVKAILSLNSPADKRKMGSEIDKNLIQEKSFKKLYKKIQDQWHGKQYHRYKKNCFDFVQDIVLFLSPSVSGRTIQKIHQQKSNVIGNYWQ